MKRRTAFIYQLEWKIWCIKPKRQRVEANIRYATRSII